ncbi:protein NDNF-like [Lineus longissimus]|uniref:protein NDNF-like n=1 Tax=Lineus longissimus TaxID=88925 RepID=UPI00315D21B5
MRFLGLTTALEVLKMTCRWIHLVVMVTVLVYEKSCARRLSSRDNKFVFNRDPNAFFYDTSVLPDGTDVTAYIFIDEPKRYFFLVEQENVPIAITITPCASPISVTIQIRDLLVGEDSDSLGGEHLFPQQQQDPTASNATFLQSFSGFEPMTYRTENSPSGIYMIDVVTNDTSSSVKILASTDPAAERFFPELPPDPNIVVSSSARRKLVVEWDPSPTYTRDNQQIEYCLSFNTDRNYKSLCEARVSAFGDVPPTVPPDSGFGFAFEKKRRRRIKQARKNALKTNEGVFFTCIGSKTRYSFNKVAPGWLYFVDVFAVDPRNNQSVAYQGQVARTKYRQKYVNLKDAKVVEKFIKRRSGPKGFKYVLRGDAEQLVLQLEACTGAYFVEVKYHDKVLKEAQFTSLLTLDIRNAKAGVYFIKVSRKKLKVASFRIFATVDRSKTLYPMLPNDTSIRVFENLSTCHSVTVAWLGTTERSRYCLYKRPVNTRHLKRQHTPMTNQCTGPGGRKKSEKIVCKRFRARNRNRAVMTEVVDGLAEDTTYVFDVYVTKRRGHTLSYKAVRTKTRSKCS